MKLITRWWRFNLVGILGFAVQMSALVLLHRISGTHYLLASAVALELTLIHNFLWHLHYTWQDRRDASPLLQFVRFELANGLVSLVGNLGIVRLLVHNAHLPLLAADATAVLLCSVANFYMANVWAFASPEEKPVRTQPDAEMVGLSILSLNHLAQYVTKAEALLEEITHICKDIPRIGVSGTGADSEIAKSLRSQRTPRKKRMYTPSLT